MSRCALGAALCGAFVTAAAQDTYDYTKPEPLPKLALVVGAEDYLSIPDLNNVRDDTDLIVKSLDTLGFDEILQVTDPCKTDLLNAMDALVQRTKVLAPDGGATVLVFFAGHGSMTLEDQYVYPVDFHEADLATKQLFELTMSLGYVDERLDKLGVAVGLSIVDACSTPPPGPPAGGVAAPAPPCAPGRSVWRKSSGVTSVERIGFPGYKAVGHRAIAFAAKPGDPAVSLPKGKPSPYVAAVVAELDGDDPAVPDAFTHAYDEIRKGADARYYPSEPRVVNLNLSKTYLGENDDDALAQLKRWKAALATGNATTITTYIERLPATPYYRPALRWLKRHAAPASAASLTALDSPRGELAIFSSTLPMGTVLRSHPVDRGADRITSSFERHVILEQQPHGDWMRVIPPEPKPSAEPPRFVRAADIARDPIERQDYWTSEILDVTACADADDAGECLRGRLAADRLMLGPGPVRVLSVEDPEDATGRRTPSAHAFDRGLAVQSALAALDVPAADSRLKVAPTGFLPLMKGRVLLKPTRRRD